MNLNTQRRIASEIMKCGESRVWMSPAAQEKISHAITRRDVRGLVKDGLVRKLPEKKSKRIGPKARMIQESKGRRSGSGSRKGAFGARAGKKKKWLRTVRPQRILLKSLRKEGKMQKAEGATAGSSYGKIYGQIKGGMFRSKHHLISHLEEHKLANVSVSEYEAAEKARNVERKKQLKILLKRKEENLKLLSKRGAEQKPEMKDKETAKK
ncbi:50S ribosomal protein L19e [archaeon]|nr:MAG: 50S ribosomal protein L19e [archaeon]